MGRMLVTNSGQRNLPPSRMELPVGAGLAEFQLPAMKPKEEHEELFCRPDEPACGHRRRTRGVGARRLLGLLRRGIRWTDPVDLFVHPRTVRIAPSAAGLVRDLEGQVSKKITNNDIAFHALRPYVPGDDRRYVHWRTSARIGQLMVRQFEETRRSAADPDPERSPRVVRERRRIRAGGRGRGLDRRPGHPRRHPAARDR